MKDGVYVDKFVCQLFGIDDLITGGLGLLGGWMAQEKTDDRLAAANAFSERMRNTAYQATMKDMKAAGLNPILAYQKGPTSSPTGAFAAATDIVSPAVSSAQANRRLTPEIQNMLETNNLIKEQTATQQTNQMLNKAQTGMVTAQTANTVLDNKIKGEMLIQAQKDAAKADLWHKSITKDNSNQNLYLLGEWFKQLNPFTNSAATASRESRGWIDVRPRF